MPKKGNVPWNKGRAAQFILQHLHKAGRRCMPIYIGDEPSDEDAFKELRHGITVRVGKKASSAAHYYFNRREDVDAFLAELERVTANRAAVSKYTRRAQMILRP